MFSGGTSFSFRRSQERDGERYRNHSLCEIFHVSLQRYTGSHNRVMFCRVYIPKYLAITINPIINAIPISKLITNFLSFLWVLENKLLLKCYIERVHDSLIMYYNFFKLYFLLE